MVWGIPLIAGLVYGLEEWKARSSTAASILPGHLVTGLSVFEDKVYALHYQPGKFTYPSVVAGYAPTEKATDPTARTNLHYVNATCAYALDQMLDKLVKLSFKGIMVAAESYSPCSGTVAHVAVSQDKIFASSFAEKPTPSSTLWEFKGAKFHKLLTLAGELEMFATDGMDLHAILREWAPCRRGRWLVQAKVTQPASIVKRRAFESSAAQVNAIARDSEGSLYIAYANQTVVAYRPDLGPRYRVVTRTSANYLAVDPKRHVLYIAGQCGSESCVDEISLDDESQNRAITLFDVDF